MRISDWSSDVCLPILHATVLDENGKACVMYMGCYGIGVSRIVAACIEQNADAAGICWPAPMAPWQVAVCIINPKSNPDVVAAANAMYDELLALGRSEEHTSELQSLMRISYAVFCLKKKKKTK